jgi:hypothetical protein
MRGGGVPGPTTVCVYVWREKELERAVKFALLPPFYFTARILLYHPVHRTNKKSTPCWKVRNTRLRYIKTNINTCSVVAPKMLSTKFKHVNPHLSNNDLSGIT